MGKGHFLIFMIMVIVGINIIIFNIPWGYGFLTSILLSEIVMTVEGSIYKNTKEEYNIGLLHH